MVTGPVRAGHRATADDQQNHPEERGSEVLPIADAVGRLQAPAATGVRTVR